MNIYIFIEYVILWAVSYIVRYIYILWGAIYIRDFFSIKKKKKARKKKHPIISDEHI